MFTNKEVTNFTSCKVPMQGLQVMPLASASLFMVRMPFNNTATLGECFKIRSSSLIHFSSE